MEDLRHTNRRYYNGSETLLKLELQRRDALYDLISQCTKGQQLIFKRMYSHNHVDKTLRKIVDDMPIYKVDWAIQQCESTIKKNETSKIDATQ